MLRFGALYRHGQVEPWMLFALIGWLFALFISLFFWMLRAPDTVEMPSLLPGRKRYRLGPEGTRRAAVTFGGLWAILTLPAVTGIFRQDDPATWAVLALPLLGVGIAWFLWRSAERIPEQGQEVRPSEEEIRRLSRHLRWFIPFFFVLSTAGMGLVLYFLIREVSGDWKWVAVALAIGVYAALFLVIKKVVAGILREVGGSRPARPREEGSWLPLFLILVLGALAAWWMWPAREEAPRAPGRNAPKEKLLSDGEQAWRAFLEEVRAEPSPCPGLGDEVEKALEEGTAEVLHGLLRKALICKITRPSYQKAKADRRWFLLDRGQPFPEEAMIRRLRDRLIEMRRPPEGTAVHPLPRLSRPPVIDGFIEETWEEALALPVPGTATRILLAADEKHLYLAADVADQTRKSPYDSLRLILHRGLSPWLSESYVFVYGEGYANSGCRISQVKWPGPPPPGGFPREERWKAFRLNECGLFAGKVKGGSRLGDHRQYELALDRKAAGILPGAAFPLGVEIERAPEEAIDPKSGRRRMIRRRYIGPLSPSGGWEVWVRAPDF